MAIMEKIGQRRANNCRRQAQPDPFFRRNVWRRSPGDLTKPVVSMDSHDFSFHSAIEPSFQSVPDRCVTPMPAQQIVPWTLTRLFTAVVAWLMAETYIPAVTVPAQADRRA